MSTSADPRHNASEQDVLRAYDGAERVALLPYAQLVAVSPGVAGEEPTYVFIEWVAGMIERPYPGSAIWRAALEAYLDRDHGDDESWHVLGSVVEDDLLRFPTLDVWLHWLYRERAVPAAEPENRRRFTWPSWSWTW